MLFINLLKNSSFSEQLKHTKKIIFTASTDSITERNICLQVQLEVQYFFSHYDLMKFSLISVFKCNLNL